MENMTGGVDYSERAQEQAAGLFGEVIIEIQKFSEKLIEQLEERYKAHPSLQVKRAINTIIGYHNEDLPREIKASIKEWIQSENSFSNSLRGHEEADESESVRAAERVESHLIDKVDSCFNRIPVFERSEAMNSNAALIMADAEYIYQYCKTLGALRDKWLSAFQKLGTQNAIYSIMAEMVQSTFSHVEGVFVSAQKDMQNISEEFAAAWSTETTRGIENAVNRRQVVNRIDDRFANRRRRGGF